MTIFNTESKVKLTIFKNVTSLEDAIELDIPNKKGTIRLCNKDTGKATDTYLVISEDATLDISAIKSPDRTVIDKAFEDHVNKNLANRALSNFGPSKRNMFYSAIWLPNSIVSKYV